MSLQRFVGKNLRPSILAKELLPPDKHWCTTCHKVIKANKVPEHRASREHKLANYKLNKLKMLSLKMWEDHRGAPLSEESAHEASINDEFRRFRQDQQRRENEAVQLTLRNKQREEERQE